MSSSKRFRSLLGGAAAIALLGTLSGCAIYNPQGHFEVSTAKVDLAANNFKVRKQGAQASAERTYILGAPMGQSVMGIPIDERGPDMQARAWEDLNAQWEGDGSCVYHNINEEWSAYGIPPFYFTHQYTITADLYEFDDEYIDYATRGERGL